MCVDALPVLSCRLRCCRLLDLFEVLIHWTMDQQRVLAKCFHFDEAESLVDLLVFACSFAQICQASRNNKVFLSWLKEPQVFLSWRMARLLSFEYDFWENVSSSIVQKYQHQLGKARPPRQSWLDDHMIREAPIVVESADLKFLLLEHTDQLVKAAAHKVVRRRLIIFGLWSPR